MKDDFYKLPEPPRNTRLNKLIPSPVIPEGEVGDARISYFEIKQDEAARFNLELMCKGQGHRAISPGRYIRLEADGRLQMTDTPAEKRDHAEVVLEAEGECLVMGLGLGMVADAMADKPEVTKVTVIEINPNVIALVHPHLRNPGKIEVICADAHEWTPPKGKKYDVIWHNIWPAIDLGDCESRNKLSRRFARRWTKFHGAWAKDEIRRQQRQSTGGFYW